MVQLEALELQAQVDQQEELERLGLLDQLGVQELLVFRVGLEALELKVHKVPLVLLVFLVGQVLQAH